MAGKQTGDGVGNILTRAFPEKRIFLKTESGTRFIRLGTKQQILALVGSTALVGWCVVATSFSVFGMISNGGAREQAAREQAFYETRLNELAQDRDKYRHAAREAQDQFSRALEDVSRMQEHLFDTKLEVTELDRGTEALRGILRQALNERDRVQERLAELSEQYGDGGDDGAALGAKLAEAETTVDFLTGALRETSEQRDVRTAQATAAETEIEELQLEAQLAAEKTDRIFSQLEEAVEVSMEPLDEMFNKVGLSSDTLIDQLRQRYDGQGGPLTPIAVSTKGTAPDADSVRANSILGHMDTLNLYRLAAEKLPFANPILTSVRRTSGFGYRRDPIRGGGRMHEGTDFAGPYGTAIHATADGVVVHAGWSSGYGRLVKIKHDFGIETRYAHMSQIKVKKGQRVSRGDQIGAMGNSGRSTGTHLHYEVRENGKAVDPLTYIEAARDVF
ncbi:DUF5930 domain-containing protein [Qingshengfaniella alkalisoli]|uniref:Peptidoglycan DD-metalloendopeptidase family protein n=1 Tax=Qingshengfaniella alkalisoli TaxID=2599296 RepID=A0A5B8J3L0_9RHOB|nr:DUF5930 domain-containing protein [Qingshengfaniella alkalisoli]QDY68880.1 peptidoglycan DD-metalloendopeptidase family protein [Qingshengfaniella alkalisoli]